jgi:hypothetical protein
MSSEAGAPVEVDWRACLTVVEDRALADELRARWPAEGTPRDVAVTDLVGLRRAYWSRIAPVPVSPDRAARLEVGRSLHRRIGGVLAEFGPVEVRFRRDGIVGRIDLLADRPVEVKSSAALVPTAGLLAARPDQLEQLVAYASLAGADGGRLLTVALDGVAISGVQVADITGVDASRARSEIVDRAAKLRDAWRRRRADDLPRCRWFGRGCEFQNAGACDCTGAEPEPTSLLLPPSLSVVERPDLAESLEHRLRGTDAAPSRIRRFRELLYVRRAYYDRRAVTLPEDLPPRDPESPVDLYERIRAGIESGPLGEAADLPTRADDPEEGVPGLRGAPWIERVSRSWDPPTAATILDRYPQYAIELGFRCVATGTNRAHLVVGWERAARDEDRLRAFDLRFDPPSAMARLWRERVRALDRALTTERPDELPPCPSWMASSCPYAAVCGCGSDAGRSQR